MLSPANAIITGALAFAIGGALLVAQPLDQHGAATGAESNTMAPARVTGNIIYADRPCTGPETEQDGAVRHDRNIQCYPMRWSASDPRLSGTVAAKWNDDVYQTDDGVVSVSVVAVYLHNDEGGWACSGAILNEGERASSTSGREDVITCVGQDQYEGLSAVLAVDGPALAFEGLIFSGDLPPVPEPPAA